MPPLHNAALGSYPSPNLSKLRGLVPAGRVAVLASCSLSTAVKAANTMLLCAVLVGTLW